MLVCAILCMRNVARELQMREYCGLKSNTGNSALRRRHGDSNDGGNGGADGETRYASKYRYWFEKMLGKT